MDRVVLITGGSTGIGAAFATRFARDGARLVLVARSEARLAEVAGRLTASGAREVRTIARDLARPGAAAAVARQLEAFGLTVDVLVNNAGFASYGRFDEQSMEVMGEELALNVTAVVELTHALLPQVVKRRGAIINVASTAAFQPVPYMAVYGATKAFVLSFSEALWAEYRPAGVRVLAVCPGATDTPFFARVGRDEAAVGARATPESVVEAAMRALEGAGSTVVPGAGNVVSSALPRLLPRATTAAVVEKLMRPRTALAPGPATAGDPEP